MSSRESLPIKEEEKSKEAKITVKQNPYGKAYVDRITCNYLYTNREGGKS